MVGKALEPAHILADQSKRREARPGYELQDPSLRNFFPPARPHLLTIPQLSKIPPEVRAHDFKHMNPRDIFHPNHYRWRLFWGSREPKPNQPNSTPGRFPLYYRTTTRRCTWLRQAAWLTLGRLSSIWLTLHFNNKKETVWGWCLVLLVHGLSSGTTKWEWQTSRPRLTFWKVHKLLGIGAGEFLLQSASPTASR